MKKPNLEKELKKHEYIKELYNVRHVFGIYASILLLILVTKCLMAPGLIGRNLAFGILIPSVAIVSLIPTYLYNKSLKTINMCKEEAEIIRRHAIIDNKKEVYVNTKKDVQGIAPISREYEVEENNYTRKRVK